MDKVNTFEIHMELKGRMTQIPDSQKIFGALIYLYKEYFSEKKTTELVASIKNREFYCGVSNMLPNGYLPAPTSYLAENIAANSSTQMEELVRKKVYQQIKKRIYIKKEQLESSIKKPSDVERYPYASIAQSQQIHAAMEQQLLGCHPDLYSVPEEIVLETVISENKCEVSTPISEFYFFLSLEQGEKGEELQKVLEWSLEDGRYFFLGSRASQGLNIFRIKEITKSKVFEGNRADYYLNLGMLLPDKVNFQKSYMNYFTSERRAYHREAGWSKNEEKRYISFLTAGSIICLKGSRREAGKCVLAGYDNRSIIYGNSMLYPLLSIGRGVTYEENE